MARFLPLAVLLLLAVLCAVPLLRGGDPSAIPSALAGRAMPHFILPAALKGGKGFSDKDLRGAPVLVNFFASWCPSCRAEQDMLRKIAAREKIRIYGIDYKDKPEYLKTWLMEAGNPFYAVGADAAGRTAIDWGVTGVPETFVVDAGGVIRYRLAGPVTEETYETALRPLLAELRK